MLVTGCRNGSLNDSTSKKDALTKSHATVPKAEWIQCTVSMHGTISDIPATIDLTTDSDFCFGTITYKKTGIPISLSGMVRRDVDIDHMIQLRELSMTGVETGFLEGTFIGNEFNGKWIDPSTDKERSFTFTIDKVIPYHYHPVPDPGGAYFADYSSSQNPGNKYQLKVVRLSNQNAHFDFSGVNSSPALNIGVLSGSISIRENTYYYENKNAGMNCAFKIYFTKDVAIIRTVNNAIECNFGNGVYIDRCYKKLLDTNSLKILKDTLALTR